MLELVSLIDARMAQWLPPLARIVTWACVSAAFSMGMYAYLSPQQKLQALKVLQKQARRNLIAHNGDFAELKALIAQDLGLSLKQMGLMFIPFVLSVLPVIGLIYYLFKLYGAETYVTFGPAWMHGFEFWYILPMLVVSLFIKSAFKIT